MQKSKRPTKPYKYPYPSRYGSHQDMVVAVLGDGKVICEDEHGEYETTKINLDNGLADPNRQR